jgi:cytochrome c553
VARGGVSDEHAPTSAAAAAIKNRTPLLALIRPHAALVPEPLGPAVVPAGTSVGAWCSGRVRLPLLALVVASLAGACAPMSDDTGRAFEASGRIIAMGGGDAGPKQACFACHGLKGEGDGAGTPRLAGLDAGYLQKQLKDYATGVRADPVMGPIAKRLDDGAQRAVAAYYAQLSSASAPPKPPPHAYLRKGAGGEPSCADCHGTQGEGGGTGDPVLAGQPADYVVEQLRRWRDARRRNDPRGVMRIAAAQLSEAETAAIAAWLAASPRAPARDSAAPQTTVPANAASRSAASHEARRLR